MFWKYIGKPLFRSHPGVSYKDAQIQNSSPVVAIGDIHGNIHILNKLLDLLRTELGSHKLATSYIFLGDYIDRGPSSKEVIDRLNEWKIKNNSIFLMGNHEHSLLTFLRDPIENQTWLDFGGIETLLSYGVKPKPGPKTEEYFMDLRDQLEQNIPDSHRTFYKQLRHSYSLDDFFFVHAGINPVIPIEKNTIEQLLWIREPFLSHSKTYQQVVIHGHSISSTQKPEIKINRVGIDTGAYATGKLTALIIRGKQKTYLQT